MSRLRDLTPMVAPKSVAIVGATPDERRAGGRPQAFLRRFGFPGPVYPVNPKHGEISGLKCYPDIDALPEAPELVIVSVPAAVVPETLNACREKGVKAASIYSSGFGEMGDDGAAIEAELQAIANCDDILVSGPNCQGVANLHDRMVANFSSTLGRDDIAAGPVSFIGQSGLFTGIVAAECHARGLGIGYLISTGNEIDVDFADFVAHTAKDPRIKVVAGYMEGARDGQKLQQAAEVARAHGKPVVILKVGRSESSAAAAKSHTGSLAGRYDVYQAAFRQYGILEVHDLEELFDLVTVFAMGVPPSRGRRVGILTNSGGIGVYSADRASEQGLELAEFNDTTIEGIRAHLPVFGSPRNPVDITLQALSDTESVGSHVRHIEADPNVDAVATFFGVQMLNVAPLVNELTNVKQASKKPFLTGWLHGDPEGEKALNAAGIPTYVDPVRMFKSLRALAQFGEFLEIQGAGASPAKPSPAVDRLDAERAQGNTQLSEQRAKAVLADAGIPVSQSVIAANPEDAVNVAQDIGYPVVLKIESPDIAHKSDIGGVLLSIDSDDAVRAGFKQIMTNVTRARPDATIDGISVHEMVGQGVELILGINQDPIFGPVVLVGSGGILVEVVGDSALHVGAPTEQEALSMLKRLRAFKLLQGARGLPPGDIDAAVQAIVSLGALAVHGDAIAELDINPLIVLPQGQGARAVDALIQLAPPAA